MKKIVRHGGHGTTRFSISRVRNFFLEMREGGDMVCLAKSDKEEMLSAAADIFYTLPNSDAGFVKLRNRPVRVSGSVAYFV